jgi:hypothetical protein
MLRTVFRGREKPFVGEETPKTRMIESGDTRGGEELDQQSEWWWDAQHSVLEKGNIPGLEGCIEPRSATK